MAPWLTPRIGSDTKPKASPMLTALRNRQGTQWKSLNDPRRDLPPFAGATNLHTPGGPGKPSERADPFTRARIRKRQDLDFRMPARNVRRSGRLPYSGHQNLLLPTPPCSQCIPAV
jgi:hypothetical protein